MIGKKKEEKKDNKEENQERASSNIRAMINSFCSRVDNGGVGRYITRVNTLCNDYLAGVMEHSSEERIKLCRQEQGEIVQHLVMNKSMPNWAKNTYYKVDNSLYSPARGIGGRTDPLSNIYNAIDYSTHVQGINIYEALPIMHKVIMSPIDLAIKKPVQLEFPDLGDNESERLSAFVYDELERLEWRDKLRKYLFYISLSSQGALCVPIYENYAEGDVDYSEPLNPNMSDKIVGVNIIPDYSFFYFYTGGIYNTFEKDYGVPHLFIVGGQNTDQSRFHWGVNNFDVATGRGSSTLARNVESIRAITLTSVGTTHAMLDLHRKYLYITNPEIYMNSKQEIDDTISRIVDNTGNYSMINLPPGFDIKNMNLSLGSGIDTIIKNQWDIAGATSDQPADSFKGSALGQIASAEKNERQLHGMIKSNLQTRHMVPVTKFIIKKILATVRKQETQFKVNLEPIYEETESEQLEIELKKVRLEQEKADLELFRDGGDQKDKSEDLSSIDV